MIDRRHQDAREELAERAKAREIEFLLGQIGEPTFIRSLMIYGVPKDEARARLAQIKEQKSRR